MAKTKITKLNIKCCRSNNEMMQKEVSTSVFFVKSLAVEKLWKSCVKPCEYSGKTSGKTDSAVTICYTDLQGNCNKMIQP